MSSIGGVTEGVTKSLTLTNVEFWNILESGLGAIFPTTVKLLLNFTGFNSLLALKYMDPAQLANVETSAKGQFKDKLNEEDHSEYLDMCVDGDFKFPLGVKLILSNVCKLIDEKGFEILSKELNMAKKSNISKIEKKKIDDKKIEKVKNQVNIVLNLKDHEEIIENLVKNWLKNTSGVKEKYYVRGVKVIESNGVLIGSIKCSCNEIIRVYTKKKCENTIIWIISNYSRHINTHLRKTKIAICPSGHPSNTM